jgi:hypothetical protein
MSLTLFLLLLSVPLGVLVTVTPLWMLGDAGRDRPAIALRGALGPVTREAEAGSVGDSSHHPATCLGVASHRARAYAGFLAARWQIEDLDPMTWILAARLRDRFETALLSAIGAVDDWLAEQESHVASLDARTLVERERLRERLARLIGSLPTFSAGLGWEHHYRVEVLERIRGELDTLAVGVHRHRQVVLHPPTAPFR